MRQTRNTMTLTTLIALLGLLIAAVPSRAAIISIDLNHTGNSEDYDGAAVLASSVSTWNYLKLDKPTSNVVVSNSDGLTNGVFYYGHGAEATGFALTASDEDSADSNWDDANIPATYKDLLTTGWRDSSGASSMTLTFSLPSGFTVTDVVGYSSRKWPTEYLIDGTTQSTTGGSTNSGVLSEPEDYVVFDNLELTDSLTITVGQASTSYNVISGLEIQGIIPEPTSFALLILGVAALSTRRRAQKR